MDPRDIDPAWLEAAKLLAKLEKTRMQDGRPVLQQILELARLIDDQEEAQQRPEQQPQPAPDAATRDSSAPEAALELPGAMAIATPPAPQIAELMAALHLPDAPPAPVGEAAEETGGNAAERHWRLLEANLMEVREAALQQQRRETGVFNGYHAIINRFGEEGIRLAGVWVHRVQAREEQREAANKARAAFQQRCGAERAREEEARNKLLLAQQKAQDAERQSERVRRSMTEEQRRADRQMQSARREEFWAQRDLEEQQRKALHKMLHPSTPRCYVCNEPNVRRSDQCPNRRNHHLFRDDEMP